MAGDSPATGTLALPAINLLINVLEMTPLEVQVYTEGFIRDFVPSSPSVTRTSYLFS